MIAYWLRIQRDELGFQKFILHPETDPTGQMTWAELRYDSMYGRISSTWKMLEWHYADISGHCSREHNRYAVPPGPECCGGEGKWKVCSAVGWDRVPPI